MYCHFPFIFLKEKCLSGPQTTTGFLGVVVLFFWVNTWFCPGSVSLREAVCSAGWSARSAGWEEGCKSDPSHRVPSDIE